MKISPDSRHEIICMAFKYQTGLMAPSKDAPTTCGSSDLKTRTDEYKKWRVENAQCIEAMLLAFENQILDL